MVRSATTAPPSETASPIPACIAQPANSEQPDFTRQLDQAQNILGSDAFQNAAILPACTGTNPPPAASDTLDGKVAARKQGQESRTFAASLQFSRTNVSRQRAALPRDAASAVDEAFHLVAANFVPNFSTQPAAALPLQLALPPRAPASATAGEVEDPASVSASALVVDTPAGTGGIPSMPAGAPATTAIAPLASAPCLAVMPAKPDSGTVLLTQRKAARSDKEGTQSINGKGVLLSGLDPQWPAPISSNSHGPEESSVQATSTDAPSVRNPGERAAGRYLVNSQVGLGSAEGAPGYKTDFAFAARLQSAGSLQTVPAAAGAGAPALTSALGAPLAPEAKRAPTARSAGGPPASSTSAERTATRGGGSAYQAEKAEENGLSRELPQSLQAIRQQYVSPAEIGAPTRQPLSGPARESGEPASPRPTVLPEPVGPGEEKNAPQTLLRDISLRVAGDDSRRIDIRVIDRTGDIRLAVRSSDPALTQALRGDLSDLVNRLDRAGYQAETWHPALASERAGLNRDSGSYSQQQQGGSHQQGDPGRDGRHSPNRDQHNQPRWVEEMEAHATAGQFMKE